MVVLCPVVARNGDMAYVVSSAYMEKAGLVDQQLYRMDLSTNMGEFRQAMAIEGMFTQNINGRELRGSHLVHPRRSRADSAGRLRLQKTSPRKYLGNGVERHSSVWTDLVVVEDPAAGYMANHNVAPDAITKEKASRCGELFFLRPFSICRVSPMPGTEVPSKVLSSAFAFSEADALELALDEKWQGTEAWIAALREALERKPQTIQTKSSAFRRFADSHSAF